MGISDITLSVAMSWIVVAALAGAVGLLFLIALGVSLIVTRLEDLRYQNTLVLKELERIREAATRAAAVLEDKL